MSAGKTILITSACIGGLSLLGHMCKHLDRRADVSPQTATPSHTMPSERCRLDDLGNPSATDPICNAIIARNLVLHPLDEGNIPDDDVLWSCPTCNIGDGTECLSCAVHWAIDHKYDCANVRAYDDTFDVCQ